MKIIVYDISLAVLFLIFVCIFLYKKRKNVKREGILLLYKANWGIKLIDKIGKKYNKALKALSYVSITVGYILMGAMFFLLYSIMKVYFFMPEVVKQIKIPPITPLIPYLPSIFKLDWLPPFYFTYWILIIAIVAITHEVAHGIFAAHNKIRIKKTGFGFFPFFLPIFLAAFVELDEKQMIKRPKIKQMAILSAGTFANVLTGIFFFGVLWLFFSLAFVPAGVTFDDYAYSPIEMSAITSVDEIMVDNPTYTQIYEIVNNETEIIKVETSQDTYFITQEFLDRQENVVDYVYLYENSPAINAGLEGAITEINYAKIDSREKLSEEILKYSPGDEVKIKTKTEDQVLEYDIVFGENPRDENIPFLGIGFLSQEREGFLGRIMDFLLLKKSNIYYESKFSSGLYFYNLLWWLSLISFSVALINMLPVGIFDGGKFFYLTVFGITKSEKKAKRAYKIMTYLILFALLMLMVFWVLRVLG